MDAHIVISFAISGPPPPPPQPTAFRLACCGFADFVASPDRQIERERERERPPCNHVKGKVLEPVLVGEKKEKEGEALLTYYLVMLPSPRCGSSTVARGRGWGMICPLGVRASCPSVCLSGGERLNRLS